MQLKLVETRGTNSTTYSFMSPSKPANKDWKLFSGILSGNKAVYVNNKTRIQEPVLADKD